MKGYLINPQLKRSIAILLLIMLVFSASIFFALNIHYRQLKEDYIQSFGAVVGKIEEVNPQLLPEIIPLLTREASQEEVIKGVNILHQYGVTNNLENHLFPYISEVFSRNNGVFLIILLGMMLSLLVFHSVQQIYFYKRIQKVTIGAKNILEGKYHALVEEDEEGDFSKLTTAFQSMGKTIRNHIQELCKEKQFLVELLSDISHQLKTPLSSMILYNDIMLEKELSRQQQLTFLTNNQKQLQRMEWLIKSLLKLARLDVNAIAFAKEHQSVNKTIEESIKSIQNKALERDITIKFPQTEEIFLHHDFYWLKEALINILVNGVEHSPTGQTIDIELIDNPIYKRITIEDHGKGISQEDLPNIFKRFYKVKDSKDSDSVGIGLALAKTIIEGQGGIIEAQSEVGAGTRFIITFLKTNL